MLLKMLQACLLWKMKLCRFLHASDMFPLKTLRELCRILHTPAMSSLKTLRELCRFYILLYEFLILDLFFSRPKNLDDLAVIHHPMDAFHMEVMCVICIFCARSDYFLWVQGSIPCLCSMIILQVPGSIPGSDCLLQALRILGLCQKITLFAQPSCARVKSNCMTCTQQSQQHLQKKSHQWFFKTAMDRIFNF